MLSRDGPSSQQCLGCSVPLRATQWFSLPPRSLLGYRVTAVGIQPPSPVPCSPACLTIYCSSIKTSNFNLKLGERKTKQSRRQRWVFAALLPCCVILSRTHTPAHSTCPWVPRVGVTQTRKPFSPLTLPHHIRVPASRSPDSPESSLVLCTPHEAMSFSLTVASLSPSHHRDGSD